MKARELAAQHGFEIGCGDNSCWFGSPGGMATNGGCRCWPRGVSAKNVTDAELQQMRQLVRKLATVLGDVADLRGRALQPTLTAEDVRELRWLNEYAATRMRAEGVFDAAYCQTALAAIDKLLAQHGGADDE